MDAKITGELIAQRRKMLEMSQAELAERLHVTDKAISKWETGRGMPGIDSLEPLAETLGLSVSEILSGRELTAEELPKTAGEQIVESMKKNARRVWQGALAALLAVALMTGGYLAYHYFTTVFFENRSLADREGLARQAEAYLTQRGYDPGDLDIVDLEKRGDYLAALCVKEDGGADICVYERDKVFSNRWRANGGTHGTESGEISTWNFGNPRETVIVLGGWDLPKEACYYTFDNSGITYTGPISLGYVLKVFVLPDNQDVHAFPILLDENHQQLERHSDGAAEAAN